MKQKSRLRRQEKRAPQIVLPAETAGLECVQCNGIFRGLYTLTLPNQVSE